MSKQFKVEGEIFLRVGPNGSELVSAGPIGFGDILTYLSRKPVDLFHRGADSLGSYARDRAMGVMNRAKEAWASEYRHDDDQDAVDVRYWEWFGLRVVVESERLDVSMDIGGEKLIGMALIRG